MVGTLAGRAARKRRQDGERGEQDDSGARTRHHTIIDDLDAGRTLLANLYITITDVADRLGVSPATQYRYLPAARAANASGGYVVPPLLQRIRF